VRSVDFWYEFASSYSYPAAMRIEALAAARGVTLCWRPFLLGPIFAAIGLSDLWSDLSRICAREGLAFHRPEPFPQSSLVAARVALALDDGARPAFSRAVYACEFGGGPSIAERATIAGILEAMKLDANPMLEQAASAPIKDKLRSETALAQSLGIFGAPNLIAADGALFWGNDRLEEGLDWAASLN
jgi:2-hydroxychromene-2-carboxylate isomerase